MARIAERIKLQPLQPHQMLLFDELEPLVRNAVTEQSPSDLRGGNTALMSLGLCAL
jgi:hypothetical protein